MIYQNITVVMYHYVRDLKQSRYSNIKHAPSRDSGIRSLICEEITPLLKWKI